MNQKVQKRLEQLIEQGGVLLSTVIQKPSEILGSIEVFADNGSDLFTQWKHSSRKVLKGLSEDDYHSFVEGEKYRTLESSPEALKRLVSILKASLDDLNYEILDTNLIESKNKKNLGDTIHYHNLNNYGNMANHNNESTVTQTSNLTVNKGDFGSLASRLKGYGVEDEYIQDLKNVIDVTPNPQSPTEYSDGVNSWIGKVTVKALTESWDVVKGVGIGIFPELIKVYYGI
jgi:hypothetical protein